MHIIFSLLDNQSIVVSDTALYKTILFYYLYDVSSNK